MTSLTEWRTSRPTLKVELWRSNIERSKKCVHSRKRGKGGEGKMQSIVRYKGFEGMWVMIVMAQCKHMWDMVFECLEGGLLLSAEHGTACVEIFTALSDRHLLNRWIGKPPKFPDPWFFETSSCLPLSRKSLVWKVWQTCMGFHMLVTSAAQQSVNSLVHSRWVATHKHDHENALVQQTSSHHTFPSCRHHLCHPGIEQFRGATLLPSLHHLCLIPACLMLACSYAPFPFPSPLSPPLFP